MCSSAYFPEDFNLLVVPSINEFDDRENRSSRVKLQVPEFFDKGLHLIQVARVTGESVTVHHVSVDLESSGENES